MLSPYMQKRQGMKMGTEKTSQQEKDSRPKKPLAKVSEKTRGVRVDTVLQAEIEAAFLKFHSAMTGKCIECGGKSCKGDPKYWKHSAAHVFPKKLFKSIAAHPLNFIELCFFGQSCHTNYDNKMTEPQEMKIWPLLVERFLILYPLMAKEERKHIPDCFMQELAPK